MNRHLLALFLAMSIAATACGDDAPTDDANLDAGPTDAQDSTVSDTPESDAGPDAQPDAGPTDTTGDVEPDVATGDYPDEITTAGASFSGVLAAGGKIEVALVANEGDRITSWLRQAEGSDWNPSLSIFKQGEDEALVWGNPQGNADAHIPYQESDLAEGWEFFSGGRYRLVLENFGQVEGEFELTLDCIAGPCAEAGDLDADGVLDAVDNCISQANADQADADGDGFGDACDPDAGNDPYEGLADGELEVALRQDHQAHAAVSYDQARDYLFAQVDYHGGRVECVYTGETVASTTPDGTGFNVEHTWPQSRGAENPPPESDMHHLFPTTAESNQLRSNNFFGEVVSNVSWSEGGSKLGEDTGGATRFEPRDAHKGNVARAMFYFAVIYEHDIPAHEESALRQWHTDDPVDGPERARNQAVADIQNSRNPFVDRPELVGAVGDF